MSNGLVKKNTKIKKDIIIRHNSQCCSSHYYVIQKLALHSCNVSLYICLSSLYFRQADSTTPIWLDSLQCSDGLASCVATCQACPSNGQHSNKCTHSSDATVQCCEYNVQIDHIYIILNTCPFIVHSS